MDSSFGLQAPTPIVRIFDEAKARAFYCDFLGFQVCWEHRFEPSFPLYMEVARDACVLHLSEHHGDACPGAAMRIAVADVDALARELTAKQASHTRPHAEDMPWGTRDMSIVDPFGNRLVFFSDILPSA